MNLTNEDKLKRDASSLLKAGWDVERITRHLVTNPADYGTGLHHDGVRPIVVGVFDDLNREVRKQNAETRKIAADVRQVIRTTAADSLTPTPATTMNAITKPMLATKCECPRLLKFPVLATPKLDGFRCLKVGGKALTRSFKPVPNVFVREWIEANLPDGVDGELMLRDGTFSETAAAIGRRDGQPDFQFHIFDYVFDGRLDEPYHSRVRDLDGLLGFMQSDPRSRHLVFVNPVKIHNLAELEQFEETCLAAGYEGVMVRTPNSPYKCGRSTEREGWLLKLKRFEDDEAVVLVSYEGMTNQNTAELDAFGRTKRSLAQAGMVGRNELGGFVVRHLKTGVEFRLGYNHIGGGIDRVTLWERRETLVGKVVKFSHQPSGAKDAPRFPKFIGFREAWDM